MESWYTDVDHYEAYEKEEMMMMDEFDIGADDYRGEPLFHHMRGQYSPYSIPPYFKRDHPDDDDWFLEELGKFKIPARKQHPNYMSAVETLMKEVVVELIWTDSDQMMYFWDPDVWGIDEWGIDPKHYPLSEKDMENLYTSVIESVVSLFYFLYPQAELFKIGHDGLLENQLDKLWEELQVYCKEKKVDYSYNDVCIHITTLISDYYDKYDLVSEDDIADMIFDLPYLAKDRLRSSSVPSFPVVKEIDKQDKLFKDIAKVVKDFNPPPSLKADEHTHWMMTFLRGDASDVEYDIMRKIIDDRKNLPMPVRFSKGFFHGNFYTLLRRFLYWAKERMRHRLVKVALPLIKICIPNHHEASCVIIEIVQVADLRRMALGVRFIGRSHLIWAFYKLGYALPLEIRTRINFDDPDEDHPPYHIYMAAMILSVLSWEKINLLHFIFATIYSTQIGKDGHGVSQLYGSFREFRQVLEETEDKIEPKHSVTVRPCRAVDALIQEMKKQYFASQNGYTQSKGYFWFLIILAFCTCNYVSMLKQVDSIGRGRRRIHTINHTLRVK